MIKPMVLPIQTFLAWPHYLTAKFAPILIIIWTTNSISLSRLVEITVGALTMLKEFLWPVEYMLTLNAAPTKWLVTSPGLRLGVVAFMAFPGVLAPKGLTASMIRATIFPMEHPQNQDSDIASDLNDDEGTVMGTSGLLVSIHAS